MSKKNGNGGRVLNNFRNHEKRLLERIDKREERKQNLDNTDRAFRNWTLSPKGDRVWSF
jgi:hypothetical protein